MAEPRSQIGFAARGLMPAAILLGGSISFAPVAGQTIAEIEPNDTKQTATVAVFTSTTGMLTGVASGAGAGGGHDYFRLRTPADAAAIYRYRLVLTTTGPAGHTGSLRGLTQSAGVIAAPELSDTAVQFSVATGTPPRMNQWYSFGKGEEVLYRVSGLASTTGPYTATLSRETITPIALSTLLVTGNITITTVNQGHATDTDFWLFDSNFDPLPTFGNDNDPISGTSRSQCKRVLSPGVYYLAISTANLAVGPASPVDDAFRDGNVMEFPGSVVSASAAAPATLNFRVFDSIGNGQSVVCEKSGPFHVVWATFTVSAEAPLAATAGATPQTIVPGGTTTISAQVSPGSPPFSTGIVVTLDASPLGLPDVVTLRDDGVPPDVVAGDSVFTAMLASSVRAAPGQHSLVLSVTDDQGRDGTAVAPLTIVPAFTVSASLARSSLAPGESTLLTATIATSALAPTSDRHTIRSDLRAIGGPSPAALTDDGLGADAARADGVWTLRVEVPLGMPPGVYTIPLRALDGRGRTAERSVAITVVPEPPANDLCTAAADAPLAENGSVSGDASTARADGGSSCALPSGADVYHRYTVTRTGSHTLSLCASAFDTVLSVHRDVCPATAATQVSPAACNDDTPGCGDNSQSRLTVTLSRGVSYIVRVASYSGVVPPGAYTLASAAPPVGACCERSGACLLMTSIDCAAIAQATWNGLGTTCEPDTCPQPPGACCTGGLVGPGPAACQVLTRAACEALDGDFRGDFTLCNGWASTPPNPIMCCTANHNRTGGVTTQDLFDFLDDFNEGRPAADVTGDGAVSQQDLLEFFIAWERGC